MMTSRIRYVTVLVPAVVLALFAACSRGGPRVEAYVDGSYSAVEVAGYQLAGRRDGSTVRATATLTLADGGRLIVELDVVYIPTPSLDEGRWRLEGPAPASGVVQAESVKFLGGQGQQPSLGGRFRLEADGVPRFRVVLPPRPVEKPGWTG
jgi:hypothetical protein